MIYKPKTVEKMWDTWMFHEGGTYYMYYLVTERSPGEGVCLATSEDGVHWNEVGLLFPLAEDAQWLGTGSVWKTLNPGKSLAYVMNFSEWRGLEMREGQQTIFFAESDDLIHWNRLDAEHEFRPDPEWYRIDEGGDSRWDCIYTIPSSHGLYGYWTANPKAFHPGFGFGETDDGVHWRALPPPVIEWGGVEPMANLEVGAVEKIGRTYHAMLGSYSPYNGHSMGMFSFTAKEPQGPFRPAEKNYALLTSPEHLKTSYFSRFFPHKGELLVNHHVMTRADARFFAPMKRADVDEEGTLRLRYWHGNDSLKGEGRALDVPHQFELLGPQMSVAFLEGTFEFHTGFIVEATLVGLPPDQGDQVSCGAGFYIEHAPENGTAVLICASGKVRFANVDGIAKSLIQEDQVDRCVPPQESCRIRLLVRESLLELYMDDVFVQCFSMPEMVTGRFGLLTTGVGSEFQELVSYEMTLHKP